MTTSRKELQEEVLTQLNISVVIGKDNKLSPIFKENWEKKNCSPEEGDWTHHWKGKSSDVHNKILKGSKHISNWRSKEEEQKWEELAKNKNEGKLPLLLKSPL